MLIVPHHHAARIAREAPRRFRGNVRSVLKDGLGGLIRVCQRRGVDMDHHLVPLSRDAGIDTRFSEASGRTENVRFRDEQ